MMVDSGKIEPLHAIESRAKFSWLVDSMYRKGWVGRPILAAMVNGQLQALTGSHRIMAARQTETLVPVYVVALTEQQVDECMCGFQDDRLAIIKQNGDADAIALFGSGVF